MKELVELSEPNYEIGFKKLLNKNSTTKILALLNALKINNQTDVPKKSAA